MASTTTVRPSPVQQTQGEGRGRWRVTEEAHHHDKRDYTFAQTFPTSTHAMWLYYWLGAHGINPFTDVKTITVRRRRWSLHARRQHGWLLCRRNPGMRAPCSTISVSPPLPRRRSGRSSGEGAGHHTGIHAALSQHHTRHDAGRAEASEVHRQHGNRGKVASIIASKSYVQCARAGCAGPHDGQLRRRQGQDWQDPDYMKCLQRTAK